MFTIKYKGNVFLILLMLVTIIRFFVILVKYLNFLLISCYNIKKMLYYFKKMYFFIVFVCCLLNSLIFFVFFVKNLKFKVLNINEHIENVGFFEIYKYF